MDYSTQGVMIVYVTIIRIEIGIVIEIIQPRSPPNIIALNAYISLLFRHNACKHPVTTVLSTIGHVYVEGFITLLPKVLAQERVAHNFTLLS